MESIGTKTSSSPQVRFGHRFWISVAICLVVASLPVRASDKYSQLRAAMVGEQIEARGITDTTVLEAMRIVPRHLFVPEEYRSQAYDDWALPIEAGQTISQPYIVGLMTSLLQPGPGDRILEIGTGSGYQAAVLAEIVDSVFTIEIIESLALRSQELLDSLGYENVEVRCGDGFAGWPEEAPFDGVVVTCAAPKIPEALIEQMAEGGRLIIPVGDKYQELLLLMKREEVLDTVSVTAVRFVPMTGPGIEGAEATPE